MQKRIKSILIVATSLLVSATVQSQELDTERVSAQEGETYRVSYSSARPDSAKVVEKGEIRFIQDESIETFNEFLKNNPPKHSGYRIQLVFGSRGDVQKAKSKFYGRYDLPAYEDYLAPNFRLRVGDFMTKLQAEKMLSELKKSFPGAYIVKDKIEVPKTLR